MPLKILLVEDEALVALETTAQLEAAGHAVVAQVDSFDAAIEAAAAEPVDLALVDINLGPGGSGIDIARALTSQGVLCLFVSGNSAPVDPQLAMGQLGKPYDRRALLAAIEVAEAVKEGRAVPPPEKPDGLDLFR